MSASLRFLAIAVIGWVGMRAMALDRLPGADMFSIARSEARPASLPFITPTEFPPIAPVAGVYPAEPAVAPPGYYGYPAAQFAPVNMRPVTVPVYYASAAPPPVRSALLPQPQPAFYAPIPSLDDRQFSRLAATSLGQRRPASPVPQQSFPAAAPPPVRLDRLQVTSWAMLRGRQGEPFGPASLANGGQLGGSQAGARIVYNVNRQLAATLRTSSDVGRRGSEVAGGIRIQPLTGLPLWLTAERRQRIGRYGSGRNAFALFAETGVYGRPLPWRFQLDAYLQGGVVGVRSRDAFVDGAASISRPLFRQFSAGVGIWGGAQPGVYRLDAGPRVSMQVRRNMRVHFDYRQRLVGNAAPGSGPAVTLAGDF